MREFDILHFDTNDSNSTYTTFTSYDTTFRLSSSYKNISKITLKSLEMPIVFTNIRTDNTSNILNMTVGTTVYNIVFGNNDYTSLTGLVSAINSLLATKGNSETRPTFSAVGNFVRITLPSPNLFYLFDSLLANTILGFPKGFYNVARDNVATIQSTYPYNLSYDNFISLYLDIPSTNTSSGNRLISYKIPLNAVNGMVFYMGQNNTFEQSIILSDPNFVLQQYRIQVFDRFGYKITQAVDYTFSLAINYNKEG